jgi:hypothetical protein
MGSQPCRESKIRGPGVPRKTAHQDRLPHENQSELQLKDGDHVSKEFDAVIEIPRGSNVKYDRTRRTALSEWIGCCIDTSINLEDSTLASLGIITRHVKFVDTRQNGWSIPLEQCSLFLVWKYQYDSFILSPDCEPDVVTT